MSKGMLGNVKLAEVLRAVDDLWTKMAGDDGPQWFEDFKRFLRKEDSRLQTAPPSEPSVERWRKLSATMIEVNLDAPPTLPFDGAEVAWITPSQTGWVRVQRKGGKLYVGGRKVVLHLVDAQKVGTIKGYDLRSELEGKAVLHPNVLDALRENIHLIPDSWKTDDQGRTRYIFFWAVGYSGSDGSLCVRCLYWGGGQWNWGGGWLGFEFGDRRPAALAS